MNILIVGDVVSKLGRKALEENITLIKRDRKINFVIVNGENISHGKGMNVGHYKWLMEQGVNVVTLGNHTFNNNQIHQIIDTPNIVRPYNYANEETPGHGYCIINYNNIKITVFQMMGTVFMNGEFKNPFVVTDKLLNSVESDIYICDFHGEATSEKIAFGYHFDGRIQIIFGTHTHVGTNDLRILPNGTAYITDIGMTGPLNGVIGTKKEIIINRFINNGGTEPFAPEDSGPTQFNAIIVTIDEKTKKVTNVERIERFENGTK